MNPLLSKFGELPMIPAGVQQVPLESLGISLPSKHYFVAFVNCDAEALPPPAKNIRVAKETSNLQSWHSSSDY